MDAEDQDGAAFRLNLGKRLKAAREHRGLSLRGAAAEIDRTFQAIAAWEKGRNPINVDDLWKLAHLYQTSLLALTADQVTADDVASLTRQVIQEAKQGARLGEPKAPKKAVKRKPPRAA